MTSEPASLTECFQQHRPHLRAVAYRMLGSLTEADDALQEAWLRIRDQDPRAISNVQAWLTTVVGRVCLNLLRARRARPGQPLLDHRLPDPLVMVDDQPDPEQQALLAGSVGLALLVVLDALSPAERLAFVLHDIFAVPFADIAAVLHRTEAAAQQLASRARRRVHGSPRPDPDLTRQREVVDAFFAASHAAYSATYSRLYPYVRPALVNGAAGAVVAPAGRVFSVLAFTVSGGQIARIDGLVDPDRLARLDIPLPSR